MIAQPVLIAVFVLLALPTLWAFIRLATWLMSNPFSRPAPRDEFQHINCRCYVEADTEETKALLEFSTCASGLVLLENEWSEIGKRIQANIDANPDFYLTDGQQ